MPKKKQPGKKKRLPKRNKTRRLRRKKVKRLART